MTQLQILFSFKGRLGRKAFWSWLLVMWLLPLIMLAVFFKYTIYQSLTMYLESFLFSPVLILYFIMSDLYASYPVHAEISSLLLLFPIMGLFLAVFILHAWVIFSLIVKRLHDRNKSGWWSFVAVLSVIGLLWLLINGCLRGTLGKNKYGSDLLDG